jgi:hypothetical protein
LHFTDNETFSNFYGPRNFKIFPVMSHLIKVFKQYCPLKASKFGIKTYELCDTTAGYLLLFFCIYRQGHTLDCRGQTTDKQDNSYCSNAGRASIETGSDSVDIISRTHSV